MAFLDDIQQQSPDTQQRSPNTRYRIIPPAVVQDLSWDDAGRIIPSEADPGSARPNRMRSVAKWTTVLIVATTIAFGAWLGLRRFPIANAAKEIASAFVHDGAAAPSKTPTLKPPSAPSKLRPKSAVVRRAAPAAEAIHTVAPDSPPDVPAETPPPAVEALDEGVEVPNPEVPPVESAPAVSGPALDALLEDENLYSGASTGIVAPRMVSLGFVERIIRGFDVRRSSMELLISKDGSVERAKLFLPSHSMQDAMLLSRAKTFRFVPAQREGFPVRYRLVLDVDATP
jgi:hypothetical protein